MLWWFEREGVRTTIEVLELPSGGFELHLVDADGSEHIEHFADVLDSAKRQQLIQDELAALGWTRSGEWLV